MRETHTRQFRIHPDEIKIWAISEWNGPKRCETYSEDGGRCESEHGHFGAHEFSYYDNAEGGR
jgi:hypothetical protein